MMPAHPTLFVRRSVYERLGPYSLDYKIASDFDMIVRMFGSGDVPFAYLPRVLVRMRTGGLSTRSWRSNLLLNREILAICRAHGIRTNVFKVYFEVRVQGLRAGAPGPAARSARVTTIAVTGANGFVGRSLVAILSEAGHRVHALVRREDAVPADRGTASYHVVADLRDDTAVASAIAGADALIHLAARAHVMNDTVADPDQAFREVNVLGSERVLAACKASGVRRFVYVSSIKVNGESTQGQPFRPGDTPNPQDPYGRSKLEAEQVLSRGCADAGLELCVVRPPLVYGPGVKGNMLRLMKLVRRGAPLPFRGLHNRRSIVAVDNLARLLERCAVHPGAIGKTFLAADNGPLLTEQIVRYIAEGMERTPRLLPVPVGLLRLAGRLTGRSAEVNRLVGSLEVDAADARDRLDWQPAVDSAHALRAMGTWFVEHGG